MRLEPPLVKFVKYKMETGNNVEEASAAEVIIGGEVVAVPKVAKITPTMMDMAMKLSRMMITVLKQSLKKVQVQTKSTLKRKNATIIKRVAVMALNKGTNLDKTKTIREKNKNEENTEGKEIINKDSRKVENPVEEAINSKESATRTKEVELLHVEAHH